MQGIGERVRTRRQGKRRMPSAARASQHSDGTLPRARPPALPQIEAELSGALLYCTLERLPSLISFLLPLLRSIRTLSSAALARILLLFCLLRWHGFTLGDLH